MAFTAKDGSMHTNINTMKQADARQMAKTPAAPPAGEPDGDEQAGGAHDLQELEQLKQAFEGVMGALGQGQMPDSEMCKQLVQYFDQFITEEEHEGEGAGVGY